ncbi:arylformamidase, variant 2 [Xanthoria calcicola]
MALSYFSSFLPFLRRLLRPKVIDNHSNLQDNPAASSTAPLPVRNGTRKLEPVEGSVWEWSARSIAQCPIQPVCNLGDGSSQSNPPAFAIEAYKSALDLVECNQYPPTGGLPRFTSTLAKIYSPLLGRDLDANSEISVHSGGTEAILSILTAFVDRGDEVVIFEPGFDLYELHVRFLGGIIRSVQLHPPASASTRVSSASEWTFDARELEAAISHRTKILIVNTPHNPLGKVFTANELATIGDIAIKRNLIVLSDEVYEHLTYGPEFIRLASLSPAYAAHTITVHSIGKAFNATGWRIGYATGPSDLIRRVKNAHIILSFTTAGPAQAAAAASLEEAQRNGFWDTNRAKMAKNIEIMCQVFEELGLPVSLALPVR